MRKYRPDHALMLEYCRHDVESTQRYFDYIEFEKIKDRWYNNHGNGD